MDLKATLNQLRELAKEHSPKILHVLTELEHALLGTRFSGMFTGAGAAQGVDLSDVQEGMEREHAVLLKQLHALTAQMAANNVDLTRLRMTLEDYERRMVELKRQTARLALWFKVMGGLAIALLIALLWAAIHLIRMHA